MNCRLIFVQAAGMSVLQRVAEPFLRDGVRSSAIWEELSKAPPLLLLSERSSMRRLGHLVRMTPGRLPGEAFRAHLSGRRPFGKTQDRPGNALGSTRKSWMK